MTTVTSQFTSTVVGALACQRDSYLKTLKTIVVNCVEITPESPKTKDKSKSKKAPVEDLGKLSLEEQKYYEIEFDDTVLFPEGGGQPSDVGLIKDENSGKEVLVSYVRRDGLLAKHKTAEPLPIGTPVSLDVNWSKRFDYMQQHTGQHLLSAILDTYNLPSLSWKMGTGENPSDLINYLEIPRKLSDKEVAQINEEVNSKILENINIFVEVPNDPKLHKTHKIPEDYDLSKGVLRIIHIGELDANPCCGTHLSSTGQIGTIALLHQTSVRGSNSRLHFLCGNRVNEYLKASHLVLKNLSSALSCHFEDINEKVDLLNTQLGKANRNIRGLLEEVADSKVSEIISKLENDNDSSATIFQYFKDKGLDYSTLLFSKVSSHYNKDIKSLKKSIVLLTGDIKGQGSLIIFGGDPKKVQEVANGLKSKIKNLKGGGKDKWQGKIFGFEKGEIEAVKALFESS